MVSITALPVPVPRTLLPQVELADHDQVLLAVDLPSRFRRFVFAKNLVQPLLRWLCSRICQCCSMVEIWKNHHHLLIDQSGFLFKFLAFMLHF